MPRWKNAILEGSIKGTPVNIRGDHVRIEIWNTLLAAKDGLRPQALADLTNYSYVQVKGWLDAWVKFGVAERENVISSVTGGKKLVYRLLSKTQNPPLIDLYGKPKDIEHRQYIWNAINDFYQIEKSFNISDIINHIKNTDEILVDHGYVMVYLSDLYQAKYLISLYKDSAEPVYTLQYKTGKIAPYIRSNKQVFDPNLKVMVS